MKTFGCKFACLLLGVDIVLGATVRLSGSAYAVLGQTYRFTCTVSGDTTPTLGSVSFSRGTTQVSFSSTSCNPSGSDPGYSRVTCGSSGVYYMDISSVGLQDATTWTCTRRSDSDTFSLPVNYGPFNNMTLDMSSPQPVTESSTLTVTCSATCNPCSYTWKKGTTTVSISRTLSLTNINRNQAGDYICTATNTQTGSAPRSTTLTVIVQYPPEVSLDTPSGSSSCRPYRVYVGQQNVQLTCRVTAANPAVTAYIWTHNGSSIPSATSSVYSLSPVSRSSGGSYTCAGRNSVGTSSSPPSLQVDAQYAPSLNLPSFRTVTEGQTLIVTCSVDSNPTASVTWTRKDGGSLPPQYGSTLTITNIQRSQTGTYVCTATNTLSPCSGAAPPSTPVTKEVTVDVQYGPGSSVTVSPAGNLERVEGSGPFTATCTAVCNPSCSISWNKGNTTFPPDQLSISNISRSDQGDYTCQAQNGIGGPGQKSFTLTVHYMDRPGLSLDKSEVMENDTVNLNCSVDSNPTVEMTIKNIDNDTVVVQRKTNTLSYTIQRVQCLHNGTYTCSVDNQRAGNVYTSKTDLNVLCYPRFNSRQPYIQAIASGINEVASFVASVISNPTPTFSWYRYVNDQLIPIPNSTVHIISTSDRRSVLQITVSHIRDYGRYAAVVENALGKLQILFTLSQVSQPRSPDKMTVQNKTATTVSLLWKSNYNGGSEQIFNVEYQTFGNDWRLWEEGISDPGRGMWLNTTLTNLLPNTQYYVQVYSQNPYGKSEKVVREARTERMKMTETVILTSDRLGVGIGIGIVILVPVILGLIVCFIVYIRRHSPKMQGGNLSRDNEIRLGHLENQDIPSTYADLKTDNQSGNEYEKIHAASEIPGTTNVYQNAASLPDARV